MRAGTGKCSIGRGQRHGFPEARVTGVFELPDMGAGNWNSGPLEKQYVLLTAGSPLQATTTPFKGRKVYFAISVHSIEGWGVEWLMAP